VRRSNAADPEITCRVGVAHGWGAISTLQCMPCCFHGHGRMASPSWWYVGGAWGAYVIVTVGSTIALQIGYATWVRFESTDGFLNGMYIWLTRRGIKMPTRVDKQS
jgi:hypothetical protein